MYACALHPAGCVELCVCCVDGCLKYVLAGQQADSAASAGGTVTNTLHYHLRLTRKLSMSIPGLQRPRSVSGEQPANCVILLLHLLAYLLYFYFSCQTSPQEALLPATAAG